MVFAQTNSLVAAHLKRQSWVTQLIVVKRNPERCIGFHMRGKRVGAQQRAPVVLGCLAGNNTARNLQSPHAKLIHFYFLRTSCQVLWTALMFRWIYCWDKTKQNPNWLALFSEYVSIHRRDPLQIFLLSTEGSSHLAPTHLGRPRRVPPTSPTLFPFLSVTALQSRLFSERQHGGRPPSFEFASCLPCLIGKAQLCTLSLPACPCCGTLGSCSPIMNFTKGEFPPHHLSDPALWHCQFPNPHLLPLATQHAFGFADWQTVSRDAPYLISPA